MRKYRSSPLTWFGILGLYMLVVSGMLYAGCEPTEKIIYVDRSSCLACHRPLKPDGKAHGIERAHPLVNGRLLTCVECHGGNNKARKQSKAHVSPGRNAAKFIKNLTIGELDAVDKKYLQFINPGDLRVADKTCGAEGCHGEIVRKSKTNPMATFAGELGIARYRAGSQNSGSSEKAIYDVRDPSFEFGKIAATIGSLSKMVEPRIPAGEKKIGPYQDLYLTKACMRCHTWSFGDNKFPGDFRSSGCTACHMNYSDDGLSKSADPTIDKGTPPHPIKHILTNKITTNQCTHCHYRGGRIGINFQGYREGGGFGFNPKNAGFLNKALHGHDASFYIKDEDTTNKHDETPSDVHFKAGMTCIDCHTKHDVHGDGHIYSPTKAAVEIRCVDCHGTAKQVSTLKTSKGNPLDHLSKDKNGNVWLTTKLTGKKLKVTQIKHSLDNAHPKSYLARSMGRDKKGFSHMDNMNCSTCHSAWIPNCYGCHVKVDMQGVQRSLISGHSTPGRIQGSRKWVTVNDMILMLDIHGKISLSMPSERMFMTAVDGSGNTVINKQIRRGPQGQVGHGHRAFNPHTIQKWSPFMRCERCHPTANGKNQEKLDLAMGFGTKRFIETDGSGNKWILDQIQDKNFKPTVLIGHNEPKKSQPLTEAIIKRMKAYQVKSPECPKDPKATVAFSKIQESILEPSCVSCHNTKDPQGQLDISKGKAWAAMVNKKSVSYNGKIMVVPGKPEQSYLIAKITAHGDRKGARMPTTGDYLWACQIDMIKAWIQQGAKK